MDRAMAKFLRPGAPGPKGKGDSGAKTGDSGPSVCGSLS